MKATIPRAAGVAGFVPRPARGRPHAAMKRRGSRAASMAPVGFACGIDVVDLCRFRRLLALRGGLFFATVYTPRELADCADCVERLAARFAAKEAISKALGCGIGPVGWRDLEICLRRARSLGLLNWELALTHTRAMAAAMVVAGGSESNFASAARERRDTWKF
jgi:holo-[acyl-carrier protein] synthase